MFDDVPTELVERLVAAERAKAAAEAESMRVIAELHDWVEGRLDPDDRRHVSAVVVTAGEIGPALHLALATAVIRVDRAVRLRDRLPAVLDALARGELDLGRVLAIDEATDPLGETAAAEVAARVLPAAVHQTAGELRAALRKAVISVDPAAAERRRQAAFRARSVRRWTRRDGTGALEAVLSAIDSGEIYDLVDETARRTKTTGDTRSVDARRADALVLLLLGREPHLGPESDDPGPAEPAEPEDSPPDPSEPPDGHDLTTHDPATHDPAMHDAGGVADVGRAGDVPVPAEPDDLDERFPPLTFADLTPYAQTRSERIGELATLAISAMISRPPPNLPWVAINPVTGPDGTVVEVGELQGYGPITVEHARQLLTTGAARAPDPPTDRAPTPAQAAAHDPPAWLDQDIRTRDGTCRAPGCRSPASRGDLDHTIAHPTGLTVPGNLGALCRRHHRLKTRGIWRANQHPDATYTWTSTITGRRYRTVPRGTTGSWTGAFRIP